MKKNKTILWIALAFVVLLGGAYLLYNHLTQGLSSNILAGEESSVASSETSSSGEEEKDPDASSSQKEWKTMPAADFTVYDIDGNEVHLSDFLGTPVVLNFWASWCGPCKSEMPEFNEVAAEYDGTVQFMMVNATGSDETVEAASSYVAEQGFTFPVFYDSDQSAAAAYGLFALPTTFFIDAEGNAVAKVYSAINRETLLYGIDMILPKEE